MVRVIRNKLRPGSDVRTRLCNLESSNAEVIGAGLAAAMAANLTAPAGVDEWIRRYPALLELDKKYVWFRPMMHVIAQRLLETVSWGLKLRLYLGAGISIMDLVTDVYVIFMFLSTGDAQKLEGGGIDQTVFGKLLLSMIVVCISMQLLLVILKNAGGKKRIMFMHVLTVVVGLKPGFDAARVASGKEGSRLGDGSLSSVITPKVSKSEHLGTRNAFVEERFVSESARNLPSSARRLSSLPPSSAKCSQRAYPAV
jgi:hypothetical protein